MTACSDWDNNAPLSEIKVELWYAQQNIDCAPLPAIDAIDWNIEQMAFFVSELSVWQNGQQQTLLLNNNDWQNSDVALLRFTAQDCTATQQDDSRHAAESGQAFQSLQFVKHLQLADNSELRFTLGLPFALNHLNPLSQASPLNLPSMFWSWRGGHKFLRLDMQSEEDAWHFHLGSTGCASVSAMRSPQAECVQPNRVQFSLRRQQQGKRLIVHLDKLLQGLELNARGSCLMQADKTSCQLLMANLADNGVFEWR